MKSAKKTIKVLFLIFFLSFCFSCTKENQCKNQSEPNVILPTEPIIADGKSEYEISVSIPSNSSPERTTIIFKTSGGQIQDEKDGSLGVKASKEKPQTCELAAKANLIAPSRAGTFTISITIGDKKFDYTLMAVESRPDRLTLSSSAFAVKTDFGSEVTLTAKLSNSSTNASAKYTIRFEDYYYNGKPVMGQFRESKLTTDNSSSASTIYSPGFVIADTFIYMKATLLDNTFNPPLKDSIKIFIIKNQ